MLKYFVPKAMLSALAISSAVAAENAQAQFEAAMKNPNYFSYQPPANDINEILGRDLALKDVRLTKEELWQAEKRKAFEPVVYIPHVLKTGRAEVYGVNDSDPKEIIFRRFSEQRSWQDDTVMANVLEEVHVFEEDQKIIFLGRPLEDLASDLGTKNHPTQPLFYVEHSVGGDEDKPLNLWKIVFLTDREDYKQAVLKRFKDQPKDLLPIFVKIYIEKEKLKGGL